MTQPENQAEALTPAQWNLLVDVSDETGCFCAHTYRPAKRLVSLGLAEWEDGLPSSDWLNITDAGREVLQRGKP